MGYFTEIPVGTVNQTVIALGKFDGFHLGHQRLFQAVVEWQKLGYTGVVFTFAFPGINQRIYSKEERYALTREFGIHHMLVMPFSKEFSQMEPEEFVERLLIQQLDMKALVVGEDFRFGRNRRGDIQLLQKLSELYGFTLQVIDKEEYLGEKISSTKIREELSLGHMELVSRLLGRGYTIQGTVVHGKGLGHQVGIPTANQKISEEKLIPPLGVYGASIKLPTSERTYYGIANLGFKPTVSHEHELGLETYIFDYEGDIYGTDIGVTLNTFIRPEQHFDSFEALLEQIHQDIAYYKGKIQ